MLQIRSSIMHLSAHLLFICSSISYPVDFLPCSMTLSVSGGLNCSRLLQKIAIIHGFERKHTMNVWTRQFLPDMLSVSTHSATAFKSVIVDCSHGRTTVSVIDFCKIIEKTSLCYFHRTAGKNNWFMHFIIFYFHVCFYADPDAV